MISFSNPRRYAEFPDWPLGVFQVESNTKGERVLRGKAKASTKACIVDGSDGRTYLLCYSADYQAIRIARHDFMDSEFGTIFYKQEPEFYQFLIDLVMGAE